MECLNLSLFNRNILCEQVNSVHMISTDKSWFQRLEGNNIFVYSIQENQVYSFHIEMLSDNIIFRIINLRIILW